MVGRPVPLLRLVALSCCLAGCSALAQPRSLLRITRLPPSPLLPHSPPLAPQRLPLAGLPLAPLARSMRPLPARSSALVLSTNAEDESSAANVEAALQQTAAAVAAAFAFAGGIFFFRGGADAEAWIAAYLLEESLSVDNLFVFSLIFDFFKTPPGAPQARVLKWGLIVAVVLRASFIVGGLAVVERFEPALVPCGLLLLYSAYGILSEEKEEDAADNPVIKTVKQASRTHTSHTQVSHTSLTPFSIFPRVTLHFSRVSRAPPPPRPRFQYLPATDEYDGDNFWTTADDGARLATPLLLALVCIEISDVLFAVDSVPAVFGVTTDPFIAFTSNAFAILGLRQLYTIISEAVNNFAYLRPAIAFILAFIGAKLLLGFVDVDISTRASLLVVAGSLGAGVGASLLLPPPDDDETAAQ